MEKNKDELDKISKGLAWCMYILNKYIKGITPTEEDLEILEAIGEGIKIGKN